MAASSRAKRPVFRGLGLALGLALLGGPAAFAAEPASLDLAVGLVEDPDFPALTPELIEATLAAAARGFAERFAVPPPKFTVAGRYAIAPFMARYAAPSCPELGARYKGGGAAELEPRREATIQFFRRWPLDSLFGFFDAKEKAAVRSHDDLFPAYVARYTKTVAALAELKTPKGTPLVRFDGGLERSYAGWVCALAAQDEFDVVVTNSFLLADLLSVPHPHAVFGKAKVGGIATPNAKRAALEGQVLLASTFGIDTPIESLSELQGKPASFEERAAILGTYLLAHELAHAVYGIPDVFDHPPGCLMTTRPKETYREGLEELDANPGPCKACQPYVTARRHYDLARAALSARAYSEVIAEATKAMQSTPKHFHGGYKKRMSRISLLAAEALEERGDLARAATFAESALKLDPDSAAASRFLRRDVALVAGERVLPDTRTATAADRKDPPR